MGGACEDGPCDVVVALAPGWGSATNSSLVYSTLAAEWSTHGACPIDFVDILKHDSGTTVTDDGPLFVHFGIDETQLVAASEAAVVSASRLIAHPVLDNTTDPFPVADYANAQQVLVDWPSALLPGATIVAASSDGKSVVVTQDAPHRSVYISAYAEYQTRSLREARQLVYNAAMWTAGRNTWQRRPPHSSPHGPSYKPDISPGS